MCFYRYQNRDNPKINDMCYVIIKQRFLIISCGVAYRYSTFRAARESIFNARNIGAALNVATR